MKRVIAFTKHTEVSEAYFKGNSSSSLRETVDALDSIRVHAVEIFSEFQRADIIDGQTEDGEPFSGPCVISSVSLPNADQYDLGILLLCSGSREGTVAAPIVLYIYEYTQILCYQ